MPWMIFNQFSFITVFSISRAIYNGIFISKAYTFQIEDYGLIITWTANKNLDLIIESDLDMVAKLFITAMEGQCYINNGLLLKRIESKYVI